MKIISGMHRSGTSLVARLFYEAGAEMGDPDHFYRPDKWNPDGYFEQPEIHAINMPLINGPWWKFAYFALPSNNTIMRRARKLADQIKQTGARYEGKVVKETRFCLTLPAWLKYGAHVDGILVCLREPMQVAHSIQKRNRTTIKHALNLWRIHNLRLLENAKGLPLRFVHYGCVLDPNLFSREMKGAFDFFGMEFSGEELESLRAKCVKPEMNHAPAEPVRYPPEVDALWERLQERHQTQFEGT